MEQIRSEGKITCSLRRLILSLDRQHQIRLSDDSDAEAYELIRPMTEPGPQSDLKQLCKLLPGNASARRQSLGVAIHMFEEVLGIRKSLATSISRHGNAHRIPELYGQIIKIWFSMDCRYCYFLGQVQIKTHNLYICDLAQDGMRVVQVKHEVDDGTPGPDGSTIGTQAGLSSAHIWSASGERGILVPLHSAFDLAFWKVSASKDRVLFFSESLTVARASDPLMFRRMAPQTGDTVFSPAECTLPRSVRNVCLSSNDSFMIYTTEAGVWLSLLAQNNVDTTTHILSEGMTVGDSAARLLLPLDLSGNFTSVKLLISNDSSIFAAVHQCCVYVWRVAYEDRDGQITVKVTGVEQVLGPPGLPEPNWYYCAAFSPDNRYLAIGEYNGRIPVLEVAKDPAAKCGVFCGYFDFEPRRTLGPRKQLTAMSWSPEGRFFALGDGDAVHFYDIADFCKSNGISVGYRC